MRLQMSWGFVVMEAVLLLLPVTLYSFFFGISLIRSNLPPDGKLEVAVFAFLALLSLVAVVCICVWRSGFGGFYPSAAGTNIQETLS